MSVSQTPGYLSHLTDEEQLLICSIKKSQECLERSDLDKYDRWFHCQRLANLSHQLRLLWYPDSPERRQFSEIERLRLTDEERFVLAEVSGSLADTDAVVANEQAAVIDGLLERTQ